MASILQTFISHAYDCLKTEYNKFEAKKNESIKHKTDTTYTHGYSSMKSFLIGLKTSTSIPSAVQTTP